MGVQHSVVGHCKSVPALWATSFQSRQDEVSVSVATSSGRASSCVVVSNWLSQ
jgi:hypothetical protein